MRRLLIALAGLTAISLFAAAAPAWAQDYPVRPIRLIVPFPPGGATDVAGRVLAQAMAPLLGNATFVVENLAGASGAVGIDTVAKSAADGYTLGVAGVGPTVTLEALGRKLPYSPEKDLVIVGHMGSLPLALASRSDGKAKALDEMIRLAKASPGKLTFGTSGMGTPGHLAFEYLKSLAGIDMLHIPYKGDAPLTTDLLGGQIDVAVLTGPAAVAQSRNPAVRILAVTSGQRSEQLPQVPTVAEAGVPQYSAEIWNVLVAPAEMHARLVDKLNGALNQALADPAVRAQLAAQGLMPMPMSSQGVTEFVRAERVKWSDVVKRSGAKLD